MGIKGLLQASSLAAITVLALSAQAQATVYNLTLTGDASTASESQFYFNHGHYDEFTYQLSGVTPFTVQNGDEIDTTVNFINGPVTIGTDTGHTDILNDFYGVFGGENTADAGTFAFYNGADPTPVASFSGYTSSTSDGLANYDAVFPPNNPAFTFTSFYSTLQIQTLDNPAEVDSSDFVFALVTPVPEPATWAMLLVGFGAIGFAMRGRKQSTIATVA